jgi:hypothetical protein
MFSVYWPLPQYHHPAAEETRLYQCTYGSISSSSSSCFYYSLFCCCCHQHSSRHYEASYCRRRCRRVQEELFNSSSMLLLTLLYQSSIDLWRTASQPVPNGKWWYRNVCHSNLEHVKKRAPLPNTGPNWPRPDMSPFETSPKR